MTSFEDLGLSEPVLAALREIGYQSPSRSRSRRSRRCSPDAT